MSKREYRRFTADQKLEALKLAAQPGVTVSEVCRKFGISASVFYRWRSVADTASASALKHEGKRGKPADAAQAARRDAEIDRLRAVIAEITAENLEMKKKI